MAGKEACVVFAVYECKDDTKELVAVKTTGSFTAEAEKSVPLAGLALEDGKTYETKVVLLNNLSTLKPYYAAFGEMTN